LVFFINKKLFEGNLQSTLFLAMLWLSLYTPVLQAQPADSLGQPRQTITGVAHFAVDPLQQLLVVDSTGLLRLYDANGIPRFQYHNTTGGELTQIDASDPFNVLLFFPEQQRIVLLDRTLSDRAALDLRTTGVIYATAVGRSHDNNIWVYDEPAGKLLLLDERGDIVRTSNDLRLSEGISQGATHLLRQGQEVWLYFPERALAVFDNLGQLREWWDVPLLDDCFAYQSQLYYRHDGRYFLYSPRQQRSTPAFAGQQPTPALFRRQLNRWYILHADGTLQVY
jgi:hypothetical protein